MSAAAASASGGEGGLLARRWRVTGFLMVAAAINYADRVAISAVFPALREELGLSDVTLGLVGSLFLWSYALASPIAGVVADRLPRTTVILGALTLWSVVTGLIGLSTGLIMLCVLRALLGVLESPYLPAAVALLGQHHTPATRARAMSAHSIGLNAGVIFGGGFAGFLAEHYGWRTGFVILGGLGLIWAFFGRRWLTEPLPVRPSANPAASGSWLAAVRRVVAIPSFRLLLLAEMLTGVTTWIFLNWLPLYFRETFQMSLGTAGLVGALMLQGAMVTGIAVGGWFSDRYAREDGRRRMLLLAGSYLVVSPVLLLFLTRPGFALVVATIATFSFLRGFGEASEKAALCEIVPPHGRATAMGCMNTLATAAGGIGVFLAGWFKGDLGLNVVFSASSVLLLISGLSLFYAYRVTMRQDMARVAAGGMDG
ncbi:MAG: MFS transporter [Verrucomicrobia bacterium]|nr:MFS transporter [Verrucomicrobiota bacterium]